MNDLLAQALASGKSSPRESAPDTSSPRPLEGEVIVVTGAVLGLTRDEAEQAISRAGGRSESHVTSKTTLLVVGEKPGATKLRAADKHGVRQISEADLRIRLRLMLAR